MTDKILFSLRDYVSTFSKVSAYKPARTAIIAKELNCNISYTNDFQRQLANYNTLVYYEHPSTNLENIGPGILTPSVGKILEGVRNFSNLNLAGKKLYCYNKKPESYFKDFFLAVKGRALDGTNLENLEYNLQKFSFAKELEIFAKNRCIISDSHGYLVWQPHYSLLDTTGRTLWNFINSDPIHSFIAFKELVFVFGEIDNRHHWNGLNSTEIENLAERYVSKVLEYKAKKYVIYELLPQLPDEVHIKKSYWCNNAKFGGDYLRRCTSRNIFNNKLNELCQDEACIEVREWKEEMSDITIKTRGIRDIHFRHQYTVTKLD